MQSDRAIYLPQQNHLYSPSFPPNKMSTVNLTLRLSPSFLKLILHVCMDFIPSSYSLILIPLLPKKKKCILLLLPTLFPSSDKFATLFPSSKNNTLTHIHLPPGSAHFSPPFTEKLSKSPICLLSSGLAYYFLERASIKITMNL